MFCNSPKAEDGSSSEERDRRAMQREAQRELELAEMHRAMVSYSFPSLIFLQYKCCVIGKGRVGQVRRLPAEGSSEGQAGHSDEGQEASLRPEDRQ